MPRGLQGRAALILLLPVVTLQLVISISFVQRHFEGVTRQMTRSVLIDLRYVAETVNAMPGRAAAAEAAARLGEPLELETRFAPAPPGAIRSSRGICRVSRSSPRYGPGSTTCRRSS